MRTSLLLRGLERLRIRYGDGAAERKLSLLRALRGRRLARAKEVLRLHEVLCYLRAFPDDAAVLRQATAMLAGFSKRGDLRRHRRSLADSGIAGTEIRYPFYWPTARWLAGRWPDRLSIDWRDFEKKKDLEGILHLLLTYSETPALDEIDFPLREWIRRLKGPGETDAAFLIRRFRSLRADSFGRETIYERLDIPIRLAPGPDTPSRTHERHRPTRVVYQAGPLRGGRLSLPREIARPPLAVRPASVREGKALIDLARGVMAARGRDLDVFEYGDTGDVRLLDCGRGLELAFIGAIPERRLMFEAVYGYLILHNGVPIGYGTVSSLFRSAEIAFNVFEAFRGVDSAHLLGRVLAAARALFGAEAFSLDPYQLGHDNPEGLKSGAWWFYYKLGFRPHDPDVRRVLRGELERMRRNPRYRSSIAVLQELTSENMFYYLRGRRKDVLGRLSLGGVGLAVIRYLAGRFGAERERAVRVCSREAARLLGLRARRGLRPGERLAWARWSPLILSLPGIERWSPANKRALARVVRAKGARRESEFVALFDAHRLLRRTILGLAEGN